MAFLRYSGFRRVAEETRDHDFLVFGLHFIHACLLGAEYGLILDIDESGADDDLSYEIIFF